jgi:Flp pilus assembly protein TadD
MDALAGSSDVLQSVIAALLNGGRPVEAENVIIHHLRADKDDWRCWLELAIVRRQRGRSKDAAIALDRARKVVVARPDQAEAFLQMLQNNPDLAELYRQVYQPADGSAAGALPKRSAP